MREFRDAWGNESSLGTVALVRDEDIITWCAARGRTGNSITGDDLQAILLCQRKWIAGPPDPESARINVNIEHDRGPFNGRAEIVGTVTDPSGAVVPGADVELRRSRQRKNPHRDDRCHRAIQFVWLARG